MSRTYRLRRLSSRGRRYVDSHLYAVGRVVDEDFLSYLAHEVLGLPCLLEGGPGARNRGRWDRSHRSCLVGHPDLRKGSYSLTTYLLYARIERDYMNEHFRVRTVCDHRNTRFGLVSVRSRAKKAGRKSAYRRCRRATKRLLLLRRWSEMFEGRVYPRSGPELYEAPYPNEDLWEWEEGWDEMLFPSLNAALSDNAWKLA